MQSLKKVRTNNQNERERGIIITGEDMTRMKFLAVQIESEAKEQ